MKLISQRLIGLTGHIGAGKSEVARILAVKHCFVNFKFAYKLKAMLKVLGLTVDEIEGRLKEQPCALLGGCTPRHAMITLGTEWGRNLIENNLWVRAAMRDVDDSDAPRIVFDDVRFPNEESAIKQRGGEIWRIVRDYGEHVTATEILNKRSFTHESESGQSRIVPDRTIFNNGTIDKLANEVAALIRS